MDVLNEYAMTLIAEYILGTGPGTPVLQYHLFGNDIAVTCTDVPSDFIDIDAPGYLPIDLTTADWTIDTAGCITNASYPDIKWTLTGPGSAPGIIYGHYVLDTYGNGVLWAQTWATPFTIPANGGTVTIAPSWQDSQCSGVSGIAVPFRRAGRDRRPNRRRK